jgi:hypothetical protein
MTPTAAQEDQEVSPANPFNSQGRDLHQNNHNDVERGIALYSVSATPLDVSNSFTYTAHTSSADAGRHNLSRILHQSQHMGPMSLSPCLRLARRCSALHHIPSIG